jgi:DNA-binding MarR family transcriptional regulator
VGHSDELLLLSLSANEARTLLALRHLSDRDGKIVATMEELGILTKYSRETLRVAVRSLEDRGLITTRRTKRNLGKLYKNEYQLIQENLASEEEKQENLASPAEVFAQKFLASTAGTDDVGIPSTNSKSIVLNTTYLIPSEAREENFKEVKLVNKWQDDGDDIVGFGLLDGEVQASLKPVPVSKRNPKTRWQRPQDDWTPADVATEFSYRMYQKINNAPAMINTAELRGALAAYRKRYNTNATIEMSVMERFFGDARIWEQAKKTPHFAHKIFLRLITTETADVMDELGMDDAVAEVAKPARAQYVFASDGKKFDNSIPGRVRLAKYEEKLEREK